MRNKIIISLIVVIGLALGLSLMLSEKSEAPKTDVVQTSEETKEPETTEAQDKSEVASNPTATTTKAEEPQAATAGTYKDYDSAVFASTSGKRILFFHASWCPQCRQLETSIKAGKITSGVTIFKVNYDNSTSLKSKYGVTLQTTVVLVDENGNLLKKHVAYDEPSLNAITKALL